MKRNLLIALVFGLGIALLTTSAWAHGGAFRGPNGGVPPGGRLPSDPEPPPPGPSDPGTPGGPRTPGDPGVPHTPPDQGHDTPDGATPSAPVPAPTAGKGNRPRSGRTLTFESWRYWWAYNNADILHLKSHTHGTTTASMLHYASGNDRFNRVDASRPTRDAIRRHIIPALLASIDRLGEHDDIVGGDIVAIGKIGNHRHIKMLRAALHNKYTTTKGKRLRFGYQARESAALAFGLLPDLDVSTKSIVREICLNAIVDDDLNRRDRVWAAVSLGLQRDKEAVKPLIALLDKKHKYVDDNIPAGILVALGLIGDATILPELSEAFERGSLFGRDIRDNGRLRAFVGYALTKIGKPEALPSVIRVLRSRSIGRVTKRSAAIAAGVLAARTEDGDMKKETVRALLHYMGKSKGDPSGNNFATIALTQIGTQRAIAKALDIMENGRHTQRPFAALGLAIRIWHKDIAAKRKQGEPMNRNLRARIVNKLRKLSERVKDSDTRAAFLLSRGLVKDQASIAELVRIAAKRSTAPVLRGYACVALGLIGQANEDVKDALRLALSERKSTDLRRNAATGLSLLRDARVVKDLLKELKKARSFAVQGQLITAIGTIGDYRAVQPLIELLQDRGQPAQTRAMAAVGLGMIGDLNEVPKLARLSKNYNYRASIKDVDELLFIL